MKNLSLIFVLIFTAACQYGSYNQNNDLYIPVNFQKAYAYKTRSADGMPGENYWQNRADYTINVELEPKLRLLKGRETVTYINNSPDTLYSVLFHLFPNYYKKGNPRDEAIEPKDAGEGIKLKGMSVSYPEDESFKLMMGDFHMRAILQNGVKP